MSVDYYSNVNPFLSWNKVQLEQEMRTLRNGIEMATARLSVLSLAIATKLSKFKTGQVIKHKPTSTTYYIHHIRLDNFRTTNPCAYKDYVMGLYRVNLQDGTLNRYKEVVVSCLNKDKKELEYEIIPASWLMGKLYLINRLRLV